MFFLVPLQLILKKPQNESKDTSRRQYDIDYRHGSADSIKFDLVSVCRRDGDTDSEHIGDRYLVSQGG